MKRPTKNRMFGLIALAPALLAVAIAAVVTIRNRTIDFSFTVLSQTDSVIEAQFTKKHGQIFSDKRSVSSHVPSGRQDVTLSLPTWRLADIRLAIPVSYGPIRFSNFELKGSKIVPLKDLSKFVCEDAVKHEIDGDALVVSPTPTTRLTWREPLRVRTSAYLDWEVLLTLGVFAWAAAFLLLRFLNHFHERGAARCDLVFLLCLAGLAVMPICHIDHGETAERERRPLATFPDISRVFETSYGYGIKFDAWFNDRFFGRTAMIDLWNGLLRSGNRNVIFGKDGWCFTRSSIPIVRNATPYSQKELEAAAANMEKFAADAKKAGVKEVVFVLSSDKERLYPEFYPKTIRPARSETRIGQLVAHLHNAHPGLVVLHTEDAMRRFKERGERVFYKTGSHATDSGAFAEYEQVVQTLARDFPAMKALRPNDFTIREDFGGDRDIFNSCYLPFYPKKHMKNKFWELRKPVARIVERTLRNGNPNEQITCYATANLAPGAPRTFMISDSFGERWHRHLAETVPEMLYIYRGNSLPFDIHDDESTAMRTLRPELVVVATVERKLDRLFHIEFPKE